MERPELAESAGEVDFIGRVESREDGVGGFDESADAFGIGGEIGDGQGMTDGRDVGDVHRFVGLRFDGDADVLVVGQHLVDRLDQVIDAFARVLGFAEVGALAGEPEHDEIGVHRLGDVDAAERTVDGVFAALGIVAGVGAVDGHAG